MAGESVFTRPAPVVDVAANLAPLQMQRSAALLVASKLGDYLAEDAVLLAAFITDGPGGYIAVKRALDPPTAVSLPVMLDPGPAGRGWDAPVPADTADVVPVDPAYYPSGAKG